MNFGVSLSAEGSVIITERRASTWRQADAGREAPRFGVERVPCSVPPVGGDHGPALR